MKNQYFGDELDYFKLSLLREVQRRTTAHLSIVWMLTPDTGGNDGGRLSYLSRPADYRARDPELFDALSERIARGRRSVAEAESLIPRARFHSSFLPVDPDGRARYFEEAASHCVVSAAAFFDPDKGLAERPKPGRRLSLEHLYLDELSPFFSEGRSLLLYQHYARVLHERARQTARARVAEALGGIPVFTIAGKHAFFVVAAAPGGGPTAEALRSLATWAETHGFLCEDSRAASSVVQPSSVTVPRAVAATQMAASRAADGMKEIWHGTSAKFTTLFEQIDREVSPSLLGWIESAVEDVAAKGGEDLLAKDPAEIIGSYALKAAGSSGLLNAPGGLAGVLLFVPDIGNTLRLQTRMIAALARRHRQERMIAPEIVLGLLCSTAGTLVGRVLFVHGQRYLLRRGSIRVLQRLLFKVMTQRVLRASVARVVPLAAGAAMGAWTWYWTKDVGERSSRYLESLGSTAPSTGVTSDLDPGSQSIEQHHLTLAGLAFVDGTLHERERAWLTAALDESGLAGPPRDRVLRVLAGAEVPAPRLDAVMADREESAALLVNLGALARRDGAMTPGEQAFIEDVIARLQFPQEEALVLTGMRDRSARIVSRPQGPERADDPMPGA